MGFDQPLNAESPSGRYRRGCVCFGDIWTVSPVMIQCLSEAQQLAPLDIDLLILGETGTGKNLLAQAIHTASHRAKGPFVAKNMGSIPSSLAEDELFGHDPGAYSDARSRRRGIFELAAGGTLFLDEIGNMSTDVQAKILSAVELKRIRRLGAEEEIQCDVRLISATNADLRKAVASGALRDDLYYRLARHILTVPPLRARPKDIPELARRFVALDNATYNRNVQRIPAECMSRLLEYPWPGNLRELRFRISSAVARCNGEELSSDLVFAEAEPDRGGVSPGQELSLAAMERRHIHRVLSLTGWCVSEAARALGIARPTLRDKIAKYGLQKP